MFRMNKGAKNGFKGEKLIGLTFLNFLSPGLALGQKSVTLASLSPLSWQHMHERSICQILEPETFAQKSQN